MSLVPISVSASASPGKPTCNLRGGSLCPPEMEELGQSMLARSPGPLEGGEKEPQPVLMTDQSACRPFPDPSSTCLSLFPPPQAGCGGVRLRFLAVCFLQPSFPL